MTDECSTCIKWLDQTNGTGLCRAHPPSPMFGTYSGQPGTGVPTLMSYFPTTSSNDWCAEWSDRVLPSPQPVYHGDG